MGTKLCLYNDLHGATIGSDQPTETSFPIANGLKYDNDLVIRYSSNSTNVVITITLAAAKKFGCIVLDRHTIGTLGDIQFIQDNTVEHTQSTTVETDLGDGYKRSSAFFTPVQANKVKIAFTTNATGKTILGYVMAGASFIPSKGAQYGTYIESNVRGNFASGAGGAEFVDYNAVKNLGTMVFNFLTDTEAVGIKHSIANTVENSLPVFASLFEGDGDSVEKANQILGYVHRSQGPRLAKGADWRYVLNIIEGSKNLR